MNIIYQYLLSNPGNIFYILTLGMFLGAIYLVFLNRKSIIDSLNGVDGRVWSILIVLNTVFIIVIGLSINAFNAADNEWTQLYDAKELFNGDTGVFSRDIYGLTYLSMISLSFRLLGVNPMSAAYLNLFLAACSIFLVFVIARVIFQKDIPGLYAAIIYLSTPLVCFFTALGMGLTTTVSFMVLCSITASVLAFRYHIFSLYALAVLFSILTAQTKPEYIVLLPIFILCFLFFKEYKFVSWKKIVLLGVLSSVLLTPTLLKTAHLRKSYGSDPTNYCGASSQPFHDGKRWLYDSPVPANLDSALKSVLNNRFSFSHFVHDLPNFLHTWTGRSFVFVLPFLIFGLISSWREPYRIYLVYIGAVFCCLSFVYLADCNTYQARYAIPVYGPIIVFLGFGLRPDGFPLLFGRRWVKVISILVPLIVLSVMGTLVVREIITIRNYANHDYFFLYHDYDRLKKIVARVGMDSPIVTPEGFEAIMLKFLGYNNVYSLGDEVNAPYFENHEQFMESFALPSPWDSNAYFITSGYCVDREIAVRDLCDLINRKYVMKQIFYFDERSSLYLIKGLR